MNKAVIVATKALNRDNCNMTASKGNALLMAARITQDKCRCTNEISSIPSKPRKGVKIGSAHLPSRPLGQEKRSEGGRTLSCAATIFPTACTLCPDQRHEPGVRLMPTAYPMLQLYKEIAEPYRRSRPRVRVSHTCEGEKAERRSH
uniref:Uncharacterized protein n=1 Tax=Macrostomum lignano TaxID=282301 RepID=A0A1I8FCL8_9PLAT